MRRTGEFRLFDDGSSYGTSVMHNGRLVNVPPAAVASVWKTETGSTSASRGLIRDSVSSGIGAYGAVSTASAIFPL